MLGGLCRPWSEFGKRLAEPLEQALHPFKDIVHIWIQKFGRNNGQHPTLQNALYKQLQCVTDL